MTDDIFKCIFSGENIYIFIQISRKLFPSGSYDGTLGLYLSW